MRIPPSTVALIGAGRVATAIGVLLQRAGYAVAAASGRDRTRERVARYLPGARFHADPALAATGADIVVIGVPDDAIAQACAEVAAGGGFESAQFVLHLSGSSGLDLLEPARARGAEVLSLHPLQSITDVDEGVRRLPGSGMAVTAETDLALDLGERLATGIGCVPFRLADEAKPLYHAAAVFCSNYLVVVEALAERLFRTAGLEDPVPLFAPLARTAVELTLSLGPAAALTGPTSRGDAGTIERNLSALAARAPEAVEPYVALARVAAGLAEEGGRIGAEDRRRIEEALDSWR
jgi:predicted short-subunit dehydrogenase-like oxidoreductase (DUF2520 family)